MKIKNFKKIGIKVAILLILSCLIHFPYDWFGFFWLSLFAPISESVFQHERILFAAYLFYSLIEYNFIYKTSNYWISRFLILIMLPWIMIMVYLLPQSFTGKMPTEGLEMFMAITSTSVVWILAVILEKDLEKIKYSKIASVVIVFLFLALFVSNIVFTFNLPVYDIFSEPMTLY